MDALRLQLFGELTLCRNGSRIGGAVPSPLAQALLVLLACHGAAGVSHARLRQLLPDLASGDDAPATGRALLEEILGSHALIASGDALVLDPAVVGSDVADFRALLAAGELERAVQVHGSRLVEGFHHRQAPAYERWLESQREALASDCAAALERLAVGAAERGEPLAAVRWWRMLAAQHPLNDRIAASLMEALVLAGDREGAIRHARYHEALVAERLDVPEDAQVLALAGAIRRSEWPPQRASAIASPGGAMHSAPVAASVRAPSSVDLLRAALADRYRVEREIGRGGFGLVLLAHDLRHHRPVAIKVMHPQVGHDSSGERFLREIRLISSLQHPNILPLFDSGAAAGQLYYVMPYIEGESLRERIRRTGRLPVAEAVGIAHQVATALEAAHRRGVVHRDIKPENLLLGDGQVMVADFGIARSSGGDSGAQLTETGACIGTPAYMSPEQAEGVALADGRSDIYSLGCVLFEMLTGEPPYGSGAAAGVLMRHVHDAVPSAAHRRRDVPPRLDRIVRRSLAKSPSGRFATAGELAQNLVEALRDVEPAVTPLARASRDRTVRFSRAIVLFFVLVLAALALATAVARPSTVGGAAAPAPRTLPKETAP